MNKIDLMDIDIFNVKWITRWHRLKILMKIYSFDQMKIKKRNKLSLI